MTQNSSKKLPPKLTPRQESFLAQLQTNPNTSGIFTRLLAEPIESDEVLRSRKVQARIETLINSFEEARNLPQVKRSPIREGIWSPGQPPMALESNLRSMQIISYLESLYGPTPWTFPLKFAPF